MMDLRKRYILYVTVLLFAGLNARGQDHLYSQYFNAPVYLNPALNGQFQGDFRANFNYRNQYTTSGSPSNYFTAALDYNIPQFGGGVGIMFNRSSEGGEFLNTNSIAGIYSYSVGSDDYILSADSIARKAGLFGALKRFRAGAHASTTRDIGR